MITWHISEHEPPVNWRDGVMDDLETGNVSELLFGNEEKRVHELDESEEEHVVAHHEHFVAVRVDVGAFVNGLTN